MVEKIAKLKKLIDLKRPKCLDLSQLCFALLEFNVNVHSYFPYGTDDDVCILELYEGLFKDSVVNNFNYLVGVAKNIIITFEEENKKERYLRTAIIDSVQCVVKNFDRTLYTVSLGRHGD